VFDDHQDRHAEERHSKELKWTVTLLVASTGPPTGFFMWNARRRFGEEEEVASAHLQPDLSNAESSSSPNGGGLSQCGSHGGSFGVASTMGPCREDAALASVKGVIAYESPGCGVLFPSMAWHRSVIPAVAHWPFEV
jgi:hypothetical protein